MRLDPPSSCAQILVATVLSLACLPAVAEPNQIRFPDLSTLEPYLSIDRGPVIETALTTREAIEAVQSGLPIPDGTPVVLSFRKNGTLRRYFVMEKSAEQTQDIPEDLRAGDWRFQWFRADGTVNTEADLATCSACHRQRRGRDYLYTFHELREAE